MDIEVAWPQTIENLDEYINKKVEEFPGWETYNYKENGKQLYNQSTDLATEIGIAAFNYASFKLGLSMMQASVAAQNIYHKLFEAFQ